MSKTKEIVLTKTSYGDVVLVVFVILKLTDNIDWSWWWVLCPLWGVAALVFTVAFLVAILEKACD